MFLKWNSKYHAHFVHRATVVVVMLLMIASVEIGPESSFCHNCVIRSANSCKGPRGNCLQVVCVLVISSENLRY